MLAYSKNRGWAKKALELSSVIHDIALSGNFHFLDVLGENVFFYILA